MDLAHLYGRVFGTPLAVAPSRLDAVLGYLVHRFTGARPANPAGADQRAARDAKAARHHADAARVPGFQMVAREDGALVLAAVGPSADRLPGRQIALIQVHGTLAARSGVDADSESVTGYQQLAQQLRGALADPSVGGILLDVDSCGGEVAGLPEFAGELLAARDAKPVFAVANTDALSAAYWLACGAEKVFATPSASVGSIGVLAAHRDQSAKDTADGLKWTFIHAGERKVDGHAHAPLPDAVRARVQARIDQRYDEFAGHVAGARGITVAAVKATKADVLTADEAKRAGLIDEVGTFDDAVNALAARMAGGKTGGMAAKGGTMLKFEELSPEAQAFVNAERQQAATVQADLRAKLDATEKAKAELEKAEAERIAKENAAAIAAAKKDACAAGSPIDEADLELVRGAFARGDQATGLALLGAHVKAAKALGGGAVRAKGAPPAPGGSDDAEHEADMAATRSRWGAPATNTAKKGE